MGARVRVYGVPLRTKSSNHVHTILNAQNKAKLIHLMSKQQKVNRTAYI